jgi:hypothetical protein
MAARAKSWSVVAMGEARWTAATVPPRTTPVSVRGRRLLSTVCDNRRQDSGRLFVDIASFVPHQASENRRCHPRRSVCCDSELWIAFIDLIFRASGQNRPETAHAIVVRNQEVLLFSSHLSPSPSVVYEPRYFAGREVVIPVSAPIAETACRHRQEACHKRSFPSGLAGPDPDMAAQIAPKGLLRLPAALHPALAIAARQRHSVRHPTRATDGRTSHETCRDPVRPAPPAPRSRQAG